jgi:hypothetical protein
LAHLLAVVAAVGVFGASPGRAGAAPDDSVPAEESSSLVPIPVGCPTPTPTDIVFTGTVVGKDYVDEFVRFEIDQLRAGSSTPWAVEGLIDVRYGADFRFLEDGQQYLVGAAVDNDFGRLSSKVRPLEPLFGGNDVIGLDDTSVECPEIEDAVITVRLDGQPVDSGVFSLLTDDRRLLAATILVPSAIAIAALIGLVIIRRLWGWGIQGIFALGRTAVTPQADQKAARVRRHREATE